MVLTGEHGVAEFQSGEASLDDWLKRRALKNNQSGASRTYVAVADGCVAGYYALAVGSIAAEGATGSLKRNMPDPIPVMVLGRLAVDRNAQGKGLGRALVKDALLRTEQAAAYAGIRGMIVHAISDRARDFYVALGFRPSSLEPMTLMVTLAELRNEMAKSG